jgi:hypothetical protein
MKRKKAINNGPLVSDTEWQKLTSLYQEYPFWAVARALHFASLEGMHAHRESLEEEFKKNNDTASQKLADLYREYLILFLHLLNRIADEEVGPENVIKVQMSLIENIAKNAQAYYEGDVASVARMLMQVANDREQFYAGTKYWVAPNDSGMSWMKDLNSTKTQFVIYIADIFGWDTNDPFKMLKLQMDTTVGLTTYFYLLSLDEWLKGPIMMLGLKNYENIKLAPPERALPKP